MAYVVRVRGPGGLRSESFVEADEARARFAELCEGEAEARVSLYAPGGMLLARRPANPARCHFCDEPAVSTLPVTGFGADAGTRTYEVFALCQGHLALLTANPGGFQALGRRWQVGHTMG